MADFLQLVIAGLATGAIYALSAIGFTLLWQASQTINFAQGEFVMLPPFFALAAMKWLNLPFSVACLLAIALAMLILGALFKTVIVDPLIERGVLPLIISTIALAIFLKEGVKDLYSAEAQPFPTFVPDRLISLLGVKISTAQLGVFVVAFGTIAGLSWFLSSTRTGRQMQATAQNPAVAVILGINVRRMILYTFLINAGLAVKKALTETHELTHADYYPPRIEGRKIVFTYHDDSASEVSLWGSFNGWRDETARFERSGDGIWQAEIPCHPAGKYLYKFQVDGTRWTEDPSHGVKEDDGLGGFNSILNIG